MRYRACHVTYRVAANRCNGVVDRQPVRVRVPSPIHGVTLPPPSKEVQSHDCRQGRTEGGGSGLVYPGHHVEKGIKKRQKYQFLT